MVIAVNARLLLKDRLEGIGYFTQEIVKQLTAAHPQHQFHFVFDRPLDSSFLFSSNVRGHVVGPPARHPLLWKWWFDVQVPRLLKKIKADVFLSFDGQCSLTTRVPQVLAVHDLAFIHRPQDYQPSHARYYRRYTPKFIGKAAAVITGSDFSKTDIQKQYGVASDKITAVHNGVNPVFQPLTYDEQELVKGKYTNEIDYFLYAGSIHPRKNIVNLLKAFSVFKRRLHSSMKLVLAGRLDWKNEEFTSLLSTYKYREDVILSGYLPEEELAKLMASAYAFVYPSLCEGFGVPVAEAMRCGVPVLTSKASAMQEVSGGAGIYFNPESVDEMADALMTIYKDESVRRLSVEKGLQVAAQYTWESAAEKVWREVKRVTT